MESIKDRSKNKIKVGKLAIQNIKEYLGVYNRAVIFYNIKIID